MKSLTVIHMTLLYNPLIDKFDLYLYKKTMMKNITNKMQLAIDNKQTTLISIDNLATLDLESIDFKENRGNILRYVDSYFNTNILLTNILHLNIANIKKLLDNFSHTDFKICENPTNIQETLLFKETLINKLFKTGTLPPTCYFDKPISTVNYLAYLSFFIDLRQNSIEIFKISQFQDLITIVLEVFNERKVLDVQDEQGYTFNDYLFTYPSVSFLDKLDKKSLINYKFGKVNLQVISNLIEPDSILNKLTAFHSKKQGNLLLTNFEKHGGHPNSFKNIIEELTSYHEKIIMTTQLYKPSITGSQTKTAKIAKF